MFATSRNSNDSPDARSLLVPTRRSSGCAAQVERERLQPDASTEPFRSDGHGPIRGNEMHRVARPIQFRMVRGFCEKRREHLNERRILRCPARAKIAAYGASGEEQGRKGLLVPMRPAFDWFEVRVPSVGKEHHLNQSGETPRTGTSWGTVIGLPWTSYPRARWKEEGPKNGIRSFS
jgi:hypothetical protein